MKRTLTSVLLAVLAIGVATVPIRPAAAAGPPALSGHAKSLYEQAMTSRFAAESRAMDPEIWPTSDGQSFVVVWRASKAPTRWVLSISGHDGFATDDIAVWRRHLEGRDIGIVDVQWWMGAGESTADYYTPEQVYHEADLALQRLQVAPGQVMLHGFSRGSTNTFAVTAIDAGKAPVAGVGTGRRYFSLSVASSGAAILDYPPTRAIDSGTYGSKPLEGTRWVTSAGALDQSQGRDGIDGMRRTAEWLRTEGATVVAMIEDPAQGHGALVLNPDNAKMVLDLFLSTVPSTRSVKVRLPVSALVRG